jgi:hypothetical protein
MSGVDFEKFLDNEAKDIAGLIAKLKKSDAFRR